MIDFLLLSSWSFVHSPIIDVRKNCACVDPYTRMHEVCAWTVNYTSPALPCFVAPVPWTWHVATSVRNASQMQSTFISAVGRGGLCIGVEKPHHRYPYRAHESIQRLTKLATANKGCYRDGNVDSTACVQVDSASGLDQRGRERPRSEAQEDKTTLVDAREEERKGRSLRGR